jgi:hypothetical protein
MDTLDTVKQFLAIGKTLTIVHFVPGRIRLRLSKSSLPLIKKFTDNETFDKISVEQFIATLEGINELKLNTLVGSATIQYDINSWNQTLWKNLCNGIADPLLNEKISKAITQYQS